MSHINILARVAKAMDEGKSSLILHVDKNQLTANKKKFPLGRKVGELDDGVQIREIPIRRIFAWLRMQVKTV